MIANRKQEILLSLLSGTGKAKMKEPITLFYIRTKYFTAGMYITEKHKCNCVNP